MLDRRLETFIHVVKQGSFSKTAKVLFISSVSIKKQVDSLEKQVGVKLLNRTNQGIELTAAGEELYNGAQRLAFLSNKILTRVRNVDSSKSHTVRLGTSLIRPCRPLLSLWDEIDCEKPSIDFEIVNFEDDTASMNALIGSLGKHIDCFIAPCDSVYWREACNILLIEVLPFCLAFPKDHPLAKKNSIDWNDLAGESIMLTPGDDSLIVKRLRSDIQENHPDIQLIGSSTHFDISNFNRCAQHGYGIQSYSVWDDVHPSMTRVPVRWEYRMPYGVIYSKNPSPAVKLFAETINEWLTYRAGA